MSDSDLKNMDISEIFSLTPIPDTCIDASIRAQGAFDRTFPGWALYSRIVRGDDCFDRELLAWALWSARLLSRSRATDRMGRGRQFVRPGLRGPWISAAGIDALHAMIGIKHPSASERGRQYDVDVEAFLRIYRVVLGMMRIGFSNYVAELYTQFWMVRWDERKIQWR